LEGGDDSEYFTHLFIMDCDINMFEINKGFIRLVDHMGDDMAIVKSARVSYGNESKGPEADKKLIKFLLKHNHGTPFEHLVFTFHIKCPIFVARQWFRHRIGSFNEISLRYTNYDDGECWVPKEWRSNNKDNKQMSGDMELTPLENEHLYQVYHEALAQCQDTYNELISKGVCREQARGILPLAAYTEFYWTVNARSLFNFMKLRGSPEAQKEIRDFVLPIEEYMKSVAPWTYEAWQEIHLNE
jgi:thymidylate synthase (FAD)